MINIKYDGRFGNNLFQYFTAVILAENNKQSISNPKNTILDKLKYNKEESKSFFEAIEINDSNLLSYIDSPNILSDINLVGFFQNRKIIKLFTENKERFFNQNKETNKGVYMHLRLGDILDTPGKYCTLDYYEKALQEVDIKNEPLYISSDSPNHEYVQFLLEKYKGKLINGNEEETILVASSFNHKILSLGTFSWWIGFFGNQNNVICPNPEDYIIWHGDLFPCLNWKTINVN